MPSAKGNAFEWTTVKRRRESHSNLADVKSNVEGSNGAVRPPGTSRATHKSNGRKYEDATESSFYTSTGTSRSSSPSSSGNSRGVNELAGASRKKKNNRKERTQQEDLDIDTDAFLSACKFAEERYSHDALVQLQHCTDYIITAFRSSEIPFSRLVLEEALEKAAEEPLRRLPGVFLKQASAYYAKMDVSSLALLAGGLLDEMFETLIPSTPHAVNLPSAKVGVPIALALVLRAKPLLALRLNEKVLAGGQQYTSQQRLPFLLWALSQASRNEPALGVAVWVRAILPQVLGQPLVQSSSDASQPPPVQKMKQPAADRALLYLSSLLKAALPEQEEEELNYAGLPKWHPGTRAMGAPDNPLVEAARRGYRWTDAAGQTVVEPVVPPTALTTVVSMCSGTDAKFGPLRSRLRLLRCCGALREIAFAGFPNGGFSCAETLLQSLNLAEKLSAEMSEAGKSPVLDGALANALAALEVDAEGAHHQWCGVYKMALAGSARLLRHLAATLGEQAQPLLRTPAGERALTSLLQGLKKKYEEYPDVVEPHPSNRAQQFALAQQAADSCQLALDQLRAVKPSAGSRRSLAIVAVLALCCIALGVYRGSSADSWLSDRVPLPSREEAAALLHAWAQQASTAAGLARVKAAPALRTLGASWAAAVDVGARGAHHAAEHLSALQQLLRARYQSYVQHAVQS